MVNGTLKNNVRIIVTIIIAPNHLKTFVPIVKSKNAINPVLICPSLIAVQLLDFAVSIAHVTAFPSLISSRNLSYIKILASTPIPIDRMIAAIPLSESA